MPRHLIVPIALACVVAGGVRAQASVDGPGFDTSTQTYRCTGGARLPVMYLNIKGGDSFATIYVSGRLVLMRSGPAASGARYVAVEEQEGFRWHVKGDVGNLYVRGADRQAPETVLMQDCKAQRGP